MKKFTHPIFPVLFLWVLIFSVTTPAQSKLYWTHLLDPFSIYVYRADTDGSNFQDILTNFDAGFLRANDIDIDNTEGKLYWTDLSSGKIQKSDLDGNNIEDVMTGLTSPSRLAVDPVNGKIFWSSFDGSNTKILKADLNGSNVEEVADLGSAGVTSIALDIPGGKLYLKTSQPGSIRRFNFDGSDPETLAQTSNNFGLLALDLQNGRVYWAVADPGSPSIERVNFDGTNQESIVNNGSSQVFLQPTGVAIDMDQGKVYWTDFSDEKIQRADLDGSNVEDVITSGLNSPQTLLFYKAGPSAIDEEITTVPNEYVLRQNYPNPFNPSTTIKFSIPFEAQTSLTIYDVLGNRVSEIVNEVLPSGNHKYQFIAKSLPSGIYFYKLKSGNYIETRKMVLLR